MAWRATVRLKMFRNAVIKRARNRNHFHRAARSTGAGSMAQCFTQLLMQLANFHEFKLFTDFFFQQSKIRYLWLQAVKFMWIRRDLQMNTNDGKLHVYHRQTVSV